MEDKFPAISKLEKTELSLFTLLQALSLCTGTESGRLRTSEITSRLANPLSSARIAQFGTFFKNLVAVVLQLVAIVSTSCK